MAAHQTQEIHEEMDDVVIGRFQNLQAGRLQNEEDKEDAGDKADDKLINEQR